MSPLKSVSDLFVSTSPESIIPRYYLLYFMHFLILRFISTGADAYVMISSETALLSVHVCNVPLVYETFRLQLTDQFLAEGSLSGALTLASRYRPASIPAGKMTAAVSPAFRLELKASATSPVSVGPPEQPRSPPSASSANIAVPPLSQLREASVKLPGHMAPTANPTTPHPASPIKGTGERTLIR